MLMEISEHQVNFTILLESSMEKKTEVLESDRSISKSCLCHSLTGSKSYAGHVASDKLQKPTEPQLALLQDEEEAGAAS